MINYFFIPPRFTLAIQGVDNVILFSMYFVIALVNGALTFKIREAEKNINKKIEKLQTFYDKIIDSDVVLSLEQLNTQVRDKVVVIKTNIPGTTLIAKEKSKKFEESIDLAVDSLKRQIEKIKTKKQE